ncbi:MAG: Do family serine endopeptidase [Blastocatellia bacterium]
MDAELENYLVSDRTQGPAKRNWLLPAAFAIVTLVTGLLAGSAMTSKGWTPFKNLNNGGNQAPIYVASEQSNRAQIALNGGFAAVAKAVTPAVVTVQVKSRMRQQQMPFMMDPFRDFFGDPDQDEDQPRRRVPQPRNVPPGQGQGQGRLVPSGQGSGAIVSADGYILTNNHVVEDAEKVEVKLTDGRELPAKVIGTDPASDVAVLKVEATGLPALTLGDSDKMEIGDIVLAVGNPLGIGQTVTMGIISAKGRTTAGRTGTGPVYEDFLQTDAPINRGNSGGALVNLNGELIGIPSQILSGTGGSIGIGFAIPTKMARNVMDQLIKNGKVRRGKLGVTLDRDGITADFAETQGYKGTRGALIAEVASGGSADKAGLKPGDIVTEFQGVRIEDNSHFRNMVSQQPPGTGVKFKVWRNGAEREFSATLDEIQPEDIATGPAPKPGTGREEQPATMSLSGVQVENLTQDKIRTLGLPANVKGGVLVTDVDPDSAAAEAGLREGEVIANVGQQPVNSVAEFNEAVKKNGKGKFVLRVYTRTGNPRFVVIKPRE